VTTDAVRRIPRLKVGVLGLVTIAVYGSWHYAFSVLLDPIIDDTGWSEPFLTSAFGASILLGGAASMAGGWLLDKFGSRFVFALAATSGLAGFALASTTASQSLFVIGSAFGGGAMAALGFYHITQTVAVRISPASSTKAIAVLTVWGAFASAVYMPATALLVGQVGWRLTLMVIAASAVLTLALAAVAIDTRTGEMPGGRRVLTEIRDAMSGPSARWFLVSQASMGIVMGVVLAYQVPAMTAAGLPLAAASFWAGVRGFSQLLGRLPLVPLVNRFGVVPSMRIAYAAIGLGTIALAFAGNPWIAATYALVAGFGIGAVSPLIGMYSRDLFGPSSLGTAMGMVSLVFMVVGAAGPPLAGWLAVFTGSRAVPVAGAGVLALVSVMFLRAPRTV
jgi:MFS family permease